LGLKPRLLSEIVDFTPTSAGPTSGVFENGLGGRVAIWATIRWRSLQSLGQNLATEDLCRWLSRESASRFREVLR